MTTFAELNLPPTVARALDERGYVNAMPVQAAVLDPKCAGRDLLVSSQTGSGKTIAFGVALAQTLLGDDSPRPPRGPRPSALVIVPTRELAAQVREELGWLLRHTGLRLASFTGGTSVSGDLGALKRGVDVGIGTPGRLVDLVRRERLDLGEIAVLVLDEADEMLDLGFREDLEMLLGTAPTERRTLLLSATLPSEIRAMARKFQRDALPIDPRTEPGAAPQSKAHDDIAYVAHLVSGGDRLAAVINVLRASDTDRAIVFCTTRDGVGELHAKLVARGFAATAISGERAQAERDRALDLLRRGQARVLVATNVAARGLHLPDVDLIVHADLPLNAESLTHRSGRTGRAGRKGTAVLIATPAERRKAERLLAMAHVRATWTPPPSADVIAEAACDRLIEELTAVAGGAEAQAGTEATAGATTAATGDATAPGDVIDPPEPAKATKAIKKSKSATTAATTAAGAAAPMNAAAERRVQDLAGRLEAKLGADELVRRLLAREVARLPVGEPLRHVPIPAAGSGDSSGPGSWSSSDRKPSPGEMSRGGVLFRVNLGAQDKAEARWLLPLICRRGGVTNREVGAIRVGPRETLFEIAGPAAADFALSAAETDPRAPHVRVERADDNARGPAQARGGRPARPAFQPARPAFAPTKGPSVPRVKASLDAKRSEPARAPAPAPADANASDASPPAPAVLQWSAPPPIAAEASPPKTFAPPPKPTEKTSEKPAEKAAEKPHDAKTPEPMASRPPKLAAPEKKAHAAPRAPDPAKAGDDAKGFGPPRKPFPAPAPSPRAPYQARAPYPAKEPGESKGFGPPRRFQGSKPAFDGKPTFDRKPTFDGKPTFDRKPKFDGKPTFDAKPPGGAKGFGPPRRTPDARSPFQSKDAGESKGFGPPRRFQGAKPAFDGKPSFDRKPAFDARKPAFDRKPAFGAPKPAFDAKAPGDAKPFAPAKKLYDAKVPHLPKGRPHELKPPTHPFKAKPKAKT